MDSFIPLKGLVLGGSVLSLAGCAVFLATVAPGSLDSMLFGPVGSTFLVNCVMLSKVGLYGGGFMQTPLAQFDSFAPVPGAAPIHVGGLLAAGFYDCANDANTSVSTLLPYLALLLGGLWSRRLGPHREI